jgi:hypothetical protein
MYSKDFIYYILYTLLNIGRHYRKKRTLRQREDRRSIVGRSFTAVWLVSMTGLAGRRYFDGAPWH